VSRDVRDACFETLYVIAKKDRNVVLLTDDMGAFSLDKFKTDLPGQYFNIGIAEQNMISVAAGMALAGKRPFLYGISSFMTSRCFEQLKLDVGAMGLPIVIIGTGSGVAYGSDGPTHHATHDSALLSTIPKLSLYNPVDANSTEAIVDLAYASHLPVFIHLEKGTLPDLHVTDEEYIKGLSTVHEGNKVAVLCTGAIIHTVLSVVDTEVKVVDVYRRYPLNVLGILHTCRRFSSIVTVEEACACGGLGQQVKNILFATKGHKVVVSLSFPDTHIPECGSREYLYRCYDMDAASISKVITKLKKRGC